MKERKRQCSLFGQWSRGVMRGVQTYGCNCSKSARMITTGRYPPTPYIDSWETERALLASGTGLVGGFR